MFDNATQFTQSARLCELQWMKWSVEIILIGNQVLRLHQYEHESLAIPSIQWFIGNVADIMLMLKSNEFYTVMEENYSNHSINLIWMTTFLNHGCKILRCVPILLEVKQNPFNTLWCLDTRVA